MNLSRRRFLTGAATMALSGSGIYELIGSLASPPRRLTAGLDGSEGILLTAATTGLPLTQHLIRNTAVVSDNGVVVSVPPLNHMVVTARLNGFGPTVSGSAIGPLPGPPPPPPPGGPGPVPRPGPPGEAPRVVSSGSAAATALAQAQSALESVLSGLESSGLLDFTPSGLSLAVAWGVPYFALLPTSITGPYMPVDNRASAAAGQSVPALLNTIAFPSDPPGTILEDNHVAFVFASDDLDNIATASDAIFSGDIADLFEVTSIRRGFVDGRYVGTENQSLTKQMAMSSGVPGADLIPDSAELFLGFTSTQSSALGPGVIANLEALPGLTNQWPNGYFANGTVMHLSHIYEDLVGWYSTSYRQRAAAAFSPATGANTPIGTQTVREDASDAETEAQVVGDVKAHGFTGHSASMQPESRLSQPTVDNYGNSYPTGTEVPLRADFNTLDNPFQYSSQPSVDRMRPGPAAGLHFLIFTPTSDTFNRIRYAMDGRFPDGTNLGGAVAHGPFNRYLHTTHRQNYLIPPRARRSFPLAELI